MGGPLPPDHLLEGQVGRLQAGAGAPLPHGLDGMSGPGDAVRPAIPAPDLALDHVLQPQEQPTLPSRAAANEQPQVGRQLTGFVPPRSWLGIAVGRTEEMAECVVDVAVGWSSGLDVLRHITSAIPSRAALSSWLERTERIENLSMDSNLDDTSRKGLGWAASS